MDVNQISVMQGSKAVAISILLSCLLGGCGPDQVVEMAEVARPVRTITIGLATGNETLQIPGSVYAVQSAELSFEVAGRMLERLVEEGQVVAKLDARDYQARRDGARASWSTAEDDSGNDRSV